MLVVVVCWVLVFVVDGCSLLFGVWCVCCMLGYLLLIGVCCLLVVVCCA